MKVKLVIPQRNLSVLKSFFLPFQTLSKEVILHMAPDSVSILIAQGESYVSAALLLSGHIDVHKLASVDAGGSYDCKSNSVNVISVRANLGFICKALETMSTDGNGLFTRMRLTNRGPDGKQPCLTFEQLITLDNTDSEMPSQYRTLAAVDVPVTCLKERERSEYLNPPILLWIPVALEIERAQAEAMCAVLQRVHGGRDSKAQIIATAPDEAMGSQGNLELLVRGERISVSTRLSNLPRNDSLAGQCQEGDEERYVSQTGQQAGRASAFFDQKRLRLAMRYATAIKSSNLSLGVYPGSRTVIAAYVTDKSAERWDTRKGRGPEDESGGLELNQEGVSFGGIVVYLQDCVDLEGGAGDDCGAGQWRDHEEMEGEHEQAEHFSIQAQGQHMDNMYSGQGECDALG